MVVPKCLSDSSNVFFQVLARGRNSDENQDCPFVYFAITSRLPRLALYTSVLTFSMFLLAVTYAFWPSAVLVLGLGGLALANLQYIVRGTRALIKGISNLICSVCGIIRRMYIGIRSVTFTVFPSTLVRHPQNPVSSTPPTLPSSSEIQ